MKLSAAVLSLALLLLPLAEGWAAPPSGKKIIDEVQQTYEKLESLSATFTHEFIWEMAGTTDSSTGTMLLAENDRFRYETDSQVIVSDGSTLWRYNKASGQVIIENLSSAQTGALPKDFLFEFPREFDVAGVEEIEDDLYRLDLTPKTEGLGVHQVQVWVDGDHWIANRLSFIDDTGNQTVYRLNDVEIGIDIPADRFEFSIPSSASVFDLR